LSQKKQTLSSFIDGEEVAVTALFDELANDPQLSQTFERYHTIGDAMRDELSPAFELDFADKISAAIEQEPTIIAPSMTKDVEVTPANEHKQGNTKTAEVIPFFGKLGQYGIAASVAAAMVIGVQQLNTEASHQQLPVFQTIPTGGYASPVSFQTTPSNDLQQELQQQQRIEQQRRMNAYIKDHLLQQRLKSQSNLDKTQ